MIYNVRFVVSHGGANSQRRDSVGIHVRNAMAPDDAGWEAYAGAMATSLRGALLPDTVIQSVIVRRSHNDDGSKAPKSKSINFTIGQPGVRVVGGGLATGHYLPDNVALLVAEQVLYRKPYLKLRGMADAGEVTADGGQYVPVVGSDLFADVNAAFASLMASVADGGGTVVIPHSDASAPSVVSAFRAVRFADWDKSRRRVSLAAAEKALELRRAKQIAKELREVNPDNVSLANLPPAKQNLVSVYTEELKDLYWAAAAEVRRAIVAQLPDWVQAIVGLFTR